MNDPGTTVLEDNQQEDDQDGSIIEEGNVDDNSLVEELDIKVKSP